MGNHNVNVDEMVANCPWAASTNCKSMRSSPRYEVFS